MDTWVLKTQQWLNSTYSGKYGYNDIEENGKTGWSTIYALIRALQIEQGISEPSDNFGSQTAALFKTLKRQTPSEYPKNTIYILQGALWCKGYSPGGLSGNFFEGTEQAVKKFQIDAGIKADGIVTAMIMKALLNMNAFVLVNKGDTNIRHIQQALNYFYNNYFGLMPCDGHYSRDTNKALIYALQAEEGMAVGVANGFFGTGTTNQCPTLILNDSRSKFVKILQWSLYCNGYDSGEFDGVYDNKVEKAVKDFQKFVCLPETGIANMPTIKSLLSSSGDTNRRGTACDCATRLTVEKANMLVQNGYKYVGRYIAGTNKRLFAEELQIIYDAGLRVFPIYQTTNNEVSYFTKEQGTKDANQAIINAIDLDFGPGTIIYFAVDFDAYDYQVTENIIPYFKAIKEVFNKNGVAHHMYQIGIYGARNICERVKDAGYTSSSFVGDMSTGFSGNLGYRLPGDWAFDQISTITLGNSGSPNFIEIDNNIASGRYTGIGQHDNIFDPGFSKGMVKCPIDGEYYPIYLLQNMTTVIGPTYHIVYEKEFDNGQFSLIDFVSGLSFEENERQPVYGGNQLLQDINGTVGTAKLIGITGVLNALSAAFSNSYIKIICEKTEDGRKRARVYAGTSDYESLVNNMTIPLTKSLLDVCTPVIGEALASNATKGLYEQLTGNPGETIGVYDISVTLDTIRSDNRYCSQLWIDSQGHLMEYPMVYKGDKTRILYYPLNRPFGEQEKYDLTYYWEGTVKASDEIQETFNVKQLGEIIINQ